MSPFSIVLHMHRMSYLAPPSPHCDKLAETIMATSARLLVDMFILLSGGFISYANKTATARVFP